MSIVVPVGDMRLLDYRDGSIERVYALLQETLGQSNVEDIDSFYLTTSLATDGAILPKLVGAYKDGELVGASLGLYLRKLNAGIILYSGVRESYRRRGFYRELRISLLFELLKCSSSGLGFVLSEIDESHWLLEKYLNNWGAFLAPCNYVQPSVQGLRRRRISLVVGPMTQKRAEIIEDLPAIIREVFRGVYRIAEADSHPDFRHAVESLHT